MTLSASIVITSYNYARYLHIAIESALGQTTDAEVVVVDDGSSDESGQIIRGFGSDIMAILFERNRGQAAALNAGVRASHGDIVMFLDSDDWAAPERTERVLEFLASHPELDMIRHNVAQVDSEGHLLLDSSYDFDSESDLRREIVQFGEAIGTNIGLAFRRSFLERVGPIPESYRTNPDTYLKVAGAIAGRVGHIDQSLAFRRIHSRQATRRWTMDRTAAKSFLDL
ncbi:MAG: glycosyltransferase family 2 protein [Acidimicrobiia bacterium]